MASAWGNSWGTAWGISWGSSAPAPVVVVDTHDGARKRKVWGERISARKRLRDQIKEAGGWPEHVVEAVEEVLQPHIKPQLSDSKLLPLVERVDWKAIASQVEEIERSVAAARQRAEDEDDDDTLLLLS